MEPLQIGEMIDIEKLQDIQDKFSAATGLAAITVDFQGVPITKFSNFTPFCQKIRGDKKLSSRCNRCDAFGGIETVRRKKPYIYQCHAGLAEFAIPIKIKGQYIGAVLAGQVKLNKNKQEQLDRLIPEQSNWQDNAEMKKAYQDIETISFERLEAAAQLLQTMISHLIEKDMMEFVQHELQQKNTKLIKQIEHQQALEKDLYKKELAALQPRINVNFLYQSLNTISRLAIIEDAPKTIEALFDIADFLQYTVKYSNKLVMLEEELAHIKHYLSIQKLRFGKRFMYEIDYPQNLRHVKIPSLILQAIVDNALVHGLETKHGNGFLRIKIEAVDSNLIMKIVDNGKGIPNDILENIQLDQLYGEKNEFQRTTGISLKAVKMILHHHYGKDYQFIINSRLHKGTSVMIVIPKDSR